MIRAQHGHLFSAIAVPVGNVQQFSGLGLSEPRSQRNYACSLYEKSAKLALFAIMQEVNGH